MKEETYKVGETIKDGQGNEWVISAKYKNGDYFDLELFHKESGEKGDLRVKAN